MAAVRPEAGEVAFIGVEAPGVAASSSGPSGSVDSLNHWSATLEVGSTLQLVAYDANGSVVDAKWSTTDASVAGVTSTGLVSGVGPGSASISARTKGKAVSALITVVDSSGTEPPPPPSVDTVEVSPDSAALKVGQTQLLTATARDASGNPLSGYTPTWQSSDPSVATVSSSGLVTAQASGTTRITATIDGKHGYASVVVSAAPSATCTTLESQSWWSPTPDVPLGGESEHVHTRVCFPYQQVVDGLYTFTVESALHHVPGWYLRNVRVQAASDQDGNRTLANLSFRDRRCDSMDCVFTTKVTVDLSTLPAGEWEFRFHSEIRPAPDAVVANLATSGWLACVRSCEGRTPQAVPSGQTEGRGWYRDENRNERGYVNARFVDPLPSSPVSGTWCPHVRTRQGSGNEPVTHSFVSVDPSFHAMPENRGMVLLDAAGTFDGRICIDTARLANGPHKLFIRADWEEGPLAGALVIPFEVANP